MKKVRICYALELRSGGLWGSGKRLLEADIVTTMCKHATGVEVPCIPATYIKGLLRRTLEELVHHLKRLKIIESENIVDKVFGPLTPMSGEVSSRPCNTIIAPLYPVKDLSTVQEIVKLPPLEYLRRADILVQPGLYGEPHVRIDDRSLRASTGALFKELRTVPGTLFYGEIVHVSGDDVEALHVARALSIAISFLSYRYAGRRTVVRSYIASIEPRDLVEDDVLKLVLEKRSIHT